MFYIIIKYAQLVDNSAQLGAYNSHNSALNSTSFYIFHEFLKMVHEEERKEWEYISKKEFNSETKDFRRVLCNYIRWDFHIREGGERFFILSLASSQEKVIAQIIMNEEIATELRNAIDKLLAGQIEGEEEKKKEEEDVMFV